MTDYFRPKVLLIFMGFMIGACGLQQSMYVDYSEEADGAATSDTDTDGSTADTGGGTTDTGGDGTDGTGGTEDGCALALTSFSTNIGPAIAASCGLGACHGATPISGSVLVEGDDAANRAVFLSYDSSADGSTMFNKISGAHAGGDQSGVLSADALSTWKAAEEGCVE